MHWLGEIGNTLNKCLYEIVSYLGLWFSLTITNDCFTSCFGLICNVLKHLGLIIQIQACLIVCKVLPNSSTDNLSFSYFEPECEWWPTKCRYNNVMKEGKLPLSLAKHGHCNKEWRKNIIKQWDKWKITFQLLHQWMQNAIFKMFCHQQWISSLAEANYDNI